MAKSIKHDAYMTALSQQMKSHASFSNVRTRKQENLRGDRFLGEISFTFVPKNRRYIFAHNPYDDYAGATLWDTKKGKIVAEFGTFYPDEPDIKFFPKVKSVRQILDALKEV